MQIALLKRSLLGSGLLTGLIASLGLTCLAAAPTYTLDTAHHKITIHNQGDVTTEINSALSYLTTRPDQGTLWTVQFDGGKYAINKMLFSERLQNVTFNSNPANPAILYKSPTFSSEYLFYTRFSKNITLYGFTRIGSTPTYIPDNYLTGTSVGWKDQGIYFGSCNGVAIYSNYFYNIGNAAIRVTTTERDPARGVNSFNTRIIQNHFDNIYQITTTSNDLIHGGSANLLVQDNIFEHIWGSIKFASRTPGATNVIFHRNTLNNSATDGIEIVGYNNVEISSNTLRNIARNAVNCYSNERSAAGFPWGDNISFKNNVINKTGGGIRVSADAFSDGFQPQPRNITISGNSITSLTGTNPALTLLKSNFPGLTVSNNLFINIPSNIYFYMPIKNPAAILSNNKAGSKILSLL